MKLHKQGDESVADRLRREQIERRQLMIRERSNPGSEFARNPHMGNSPARAMWAHLGERDPENVAKTQMDCDHSDSPHHREQFLKQRRERKGLHKVDTRRPADFEISMAASRGGGGDGGSSRLSARLGAAAADGGGVAAAGGVAEELEHASACQHMLQNVLEADLKVFAAARAEVISLVEGGADVDTRNSAGMTAHTTAIWAGEDKLASQLVLAHGATDDFGCFVARQRLAWAWCVTASSDDECQFEDQFPLANMWRWYSSVELIGLSVSISTSRGDMVAAMTRDAFFLRQQPADGAPSLLMAGTGAAAGTGAPVPAFMRSTEQFSRKHRHEPWHYLEGQPLGDEHGAESPSPTGKQGSPKHALRAARDVAILVHHPAGVRKTKGRKGAAAPVAAEGRPIHDYWGGPAGSAAHPRPARALTRY
eukprot:SAG22_NODE_226_length_14668_cov_29.647495_3_plen_423_part_00